MKSLKKEKAKLQLPEIDLVAKGDRVIVFQFDAEDKVGRIIVPDTAKEKPHKGIVVACGKGSIDSPMDTYVGEVVLFGKYSGSEYMHKGNTFMIMRNSDLAAGVIITPDALEEALVRSVHKP